ncbi:hypothetical protein LINPERHAP1_LOCUS33852 [Linum perenne]
MDYKFCCCVVDFYRCMQRNHPVGYRIPSLGSKLLVGSHGRRPYQRQ